MCKYAENLSGDCYECTANIQCESQRFDLNEDGSINIIICEKEQEHD